MREVRRQTRVVGAFPDGNSALMLVAARLRHVAGTKWGTRKYLNMSRLAEQDTEKFKNLPTQIGNLNGTQVRDALRASAPSL